MVLKLRTVKALNIISIPTIDANIKTFKIVYFSVVLNQLQLIDGQKIPNPLINKKNNLKTYPNTILTASGE